MARRLLSKAALSAIAVVGFAGLTHAQFCPPLIPSGYGPQAPASLPFVPPQGNQVIGDGAGGCANCGDGAAAGSKHPVLNVLSGHAFLTDHEPIGCWTNHNMFGCSSFHSEFTFIFGSCRAFFGQTCLKQPPPDALAPMLDGTPYAVPPPRARLPFTFCPSCR